MQLPMMDTPLDNLPLDQDKEIQVTLVIGAGHFGAKATKILAEKGVTPLWVVDSEQEKIVNIRHFPVQCINSDGVKFLVDNSKALSPESLIVPAVPLHLAFEWLKGSVKESKVIQQIRPPDVLKTILPNPIEGTEGSLLVSFAAGFICPDDCPEPPFCTVTGEKRDKPLFQLLEEVKVRNFGTHVIRSHQLAPGLGGYQFKELIQLRNAVENQDTAKWLLATSCRCHGVVTCFKVDPVS